MKKSIVFLIIGILLIGVLTTMVVKHKAVKVHGDRGYATEWNDEHELEGVMLINEDLRNMAQLLYAFEYHGFSSFFDPQFNHLTFQVRGTECDYYWTLNEAAGVDAHDHKGVLDATWNLAPTWEAGKLHNCATTDGTQQMSCNFKYNVGTRPWSTAFWMKTVAAGGVVLSNYASNPFQKGFNVIIQATGGLGMQFSNGAGGFQTPAPWTSPINDGAWHHIVITKNGVSDDISFWIDGNYEITVINTQSDLANNNNNITFFAQSDGASNLIGSLDNVKWYWDFEMDQGQVDFDYAAGAGKEYDDLSFPTDTVESDVIITNAIITANVDTSGGGSIQLKLSADGGTSWENVDNDKIHVFANTGTELQVDVAIVGDAEVLEYAIRWNV